MGIIGSHIDVAGNSEVKPSGKQPLRTEAPRERVEPALGFCRALIEGAFIDALQTKDGQPTLEAEEAFTWLSLSLNWTKRSDGKIPPPELRSEYWGSFSWCCEWLNFDEDELRENGLPRRTVRAQPFRGTVVPRHAQHTRPIRAGGKHARHVAGFEEIRRTWANAKREYQEKQAQLSDDVLQTNGNVAVVQGDDADDVNHHPTPECAPDGVSVHSSDGQLELDMVAIQIDAVNATLDEVRA